MKAIDVHSHLSTKKGSMLRYDPDMVKAFDKSYPKFGGYTKTEHEMAQDFIDLDIKALIIAWDAETNTAEPKVANDYVAQLVKDFPEAFLGGWAMIDPWKGKVAINELERAVKELHLMGLKFQSIVQGFFPNDRRFYPLYEKCVELGVPVMFHTGTTGAGASLPGGGGFHLKYTQPICLDDIAADFPELTIVAAHAGWPWTDELIAVLLHKGNVYMEMSAYRPKYWPDNLKHFAAGVLQDKIMFGSEYPLIPHKIYLEDIEAMFKAEVAEKLMYKNAQRILGMSI